MSRSGSPGANSTQKAAPFSRASTIEWEDLPSFADAPGGPLYHIGESHASGPIASLTARTETVAACLDSPAVSGQFQEAVAGLATREVLEP